MNILFHILAIAGFLGYFLAACCYLSLFLPHPFTSTATARRLLIGGFVLHLLFLLEQGLGLAFPGPGLLSQIEVLPNFALTLSLVALFSVGGYLLIEKSKNVFFLGAIISPIAMLLLLFSSYLFHQEPSAAAPLKNDYLLLFHISLTVLGHAAFLLAFGVSTALIVQESLLKKKKLQRLQKLLPPLRLLDRLNSQFLCTGFLLMTLGVFLGVVFAARVDLSFMVMNVRVFWSFVTLTIYAALLLAIVFYGLRGRRAAWMSVLGFATVLASFVSSRLVESGFHVH